VEHVLLGRESTHRPQSERDYDDLPRPKDVTEKELKDRYQELGQAHVFGFWEELTEAERATLLLQATRLEPELPEHLAAVSRALKPGEGESSAGLPGLRPLKKAIALPQDAASEALFESARERGRQVLEAGRVAVLVVAGGQGSRLGYPGPKGNYPVGPVTDRTLFALQAQKLRGLRARIGCSVPWYVMTSPATDAATRESFEQADFFGLGRDQVFFFTQGMAPAAGLDGRLLLASPGRIVETPNGHGGVLTALQASGGLEDMERRGADLIFYYHVDNPLVQIGDPAYLGFHVQQEAEMSCKVIRKTDPMAKVGVVAEVEGHPAMLEYTELSDSLRNARDEQGELLYWAGNIGMHLFTTSFVRRVAESAAANLPYHASAKAIPSVDESGTTQQPSEPNGYKLERFVFDALPASRATCVMEVDPKQEFSPIKNAEGGESPASARRDLNRLYRLWMEAAGRPCPGQDRSIEIDHAYIDNLDDARSIALQPDLDREGLICLGPEVHV
jgi:UDP-N-acetylglucosamine/UDP-N-acetylgalactosamine diphosphorylase